MHVTACLAGQKVDVEVGEDCRSLQALKEAIVEALPKLCVEGFDVSVGGRALDDDEGVVSLEDSACLDVSANTRGLSTLALREAGREVGEEGLLHAAAEGDVGLCTLYLDAGVPIDCATAKGSTPLLISCCEGHLETARLLLDRGSNAIDEKDGEGYTPLHFSCHNGHLEIATLLLDRGSNAIDEKDGDGDTPLHLSCYVGHLEIVTLLLDRGSNVIDEKTVKGHTPLLFSCSNGHLEIARLLLDRGSNAIDEKDGEGNTPLLDSCHNGHLEIATLLLDRGSNALDEKTVKGHTPLLHSCHNGHLGGPIGCTRRLVADPGGARSPAKKCTHPGTRRGEQEGQDVQVVVRTLEGAAILLDVNLGSDAVDVVERLAGRTRVPAAAMRLTSEGRQLQSGVPLREYGVRRDSQLIALPRLRGGGKVRKAPFDGLESDASPGGLRNNVSYSDAARNARPDDCPYRRPPARRAAAPLDTGAPLSPPTSMPISPPPLVPLPPPPPPPPPLPPPTFAETMEEDARLARSPNSGRASGYGRADGGQREAVRLRALIRKNLPQYEEAKQGPARWLETWVANKLRCSTRDVRVFNPERRREGIDALVCLSLSGAADLATTLPAAGLLNFAVKTAGRSLWDVGPCPMNWTWEEASAALRRSGWQQASLVAVIPKPHSSVVVVRGPEPRAGVSLVDGASHGRCGPPPGKGNGRKRPERRQAPAAAELYPPRDAGEAEELRAKLGKAEAIVGDLKEQMAAAAETEKANLAEQKAKAAKSIKKWRDHYDAIRAAKKDLGVQCEKLQKKVVELEDERDACARPAESSEELLALRKRCQNLVSAADEAEEQQCKVKEELRNVREELKARSEEIASARQAAEVAAEVWHSSEVQTMKTADHDRAKLEAEKRALKEALATEQSARFVDEARRLQVVTERDALGATATALRAELDVAVKDAATRPKGKADGEVLIATLRDTLKDERRRNVEATSSWDAERAKLRGELDRQRKIAAALQAHAERMAEKELNAVPEAVPEAKKPCSKPSKQGSKVRSPPKAAQSPKDKSAPQQTTLSFAGTPKAAAKALKRKGSTSPDSYATRCGSPRKKTRAKGAKAE